MIINYIPLATALAGTTIAAIWDLKTTEVPDQLPYIMIAIALFFYSYQSIIEWSFWPIVNSLIYGLAFLGFGGFMYYIGQWGAADSWILAAIGFLLPVTSQGFESTILPFPLSYFINLFIIGAVYMLLYAFVFALRNRIVFSGFVTDLKASVNILVIGFIGLFILFYAVGLNITKILYGSIDFTRAFYISLYPVFSVSVLYLIWKFIKAVELYGFRKKIHISKLKVGDMLLSERKLVGITEEQIKHLKKSGKRYVDIRYGVPFAPAFPVALLITLFYGDLILFLINFI
ncbi:MAG: prepilin peptidase [Candidatus Aenigmatarchaeota archaeon]|nr:prepilin peptidase [Candidatus Aenigmarchaeota archaeon]